MSRESTIHDIRVELVKVREQLAGLQEKEKMLEGTLKHFLSLPAEDAQPSNTQALRDELFKHLATVGRPLHRNELFEHLKSVGIHVNGQNPVGNMTAHMSQDARFVSFGEGKWGLAIWQAPPPPPPVGRPTPPPVGTPPPPPVGTPTPPPVGTPPPPPVGKPTPPPVGTPTPPPVIQPPSVRW